MRLVPVQVLDALSARGEKTLGVEKVKKRRLRGCAKGWFINVSTWRGTFSLSKDCTPLPCQQFTAPGQMIRIWSDYGWRPFYDVYLWGVQKSWWRILVNDSQRPNFVQSEIFIVVGFLKLLTGYRSNATIYRCIVRRSINGSQKENENFSRSCQYFHEHVISL